MTPVLVSVDKAGDLKLGRKKCRLHKKDDVVKVAKNYGVPNAGKKTVKQLCGSIKSKAKASNDGMNNVPLAAYLRVLRAPAFFPDIDAIAGRRVLVRVPGFVSTAGWRPVSGAGTKWIVRRTNLEGRVRRPELWQGLPGPRAKCQIVVLAKFRRDSRSECRLSEESAERHDTRHNWPHPWPPSPQSRPAHALLCRLGAPPGPRHA